MCCVGSSHKERILTALCSLENLPTEATVPVGPWQEALTPDNLAAALAHEVHARIQTLQDTVPATPVCHELHADAQSLMGLMPPWRQVRSKAIMEVAMALKSTSSWCDSGNFTAGYA
jgi:hypothetical protein